VRGRHGRQHASQTDVVSEFDELAEGVDTDYFPLPRHTVVLRDTWAGILKVQLEETLDKLSEPARNELADQSGGTGQVGQLITPDSVVQFGLTPVLPGRLRPATAAAPTASIENVPGSGTGSVS